MAANKERAGKMFRLALIAFAVNTVWLTVSMFMRSYAVHYELWYADAFEGCIVASSLMKFVIVPVCVFSGVACVGAKD